MRTFFLLALFCSTACCAQDNIVVKAGTPLSKVFSQADLYQYPQFQPGRVFYKDGHTSSGKLNYHRLYDELQFVAPGGDTMAVDNEATIRLVAVGTDTFYYADGFIRLLSNTANVKLAVRQWLKLVDREKYGGYGQASATSLIYSLKTLDDGRRPYDLVVKENLVIHRETKYYLANSEDNYLVATRKNLLALYPQHDATLRAYLKANKVNFEDRSAMEQLVAYLRELEQKKK